jgi:ubiquinone/menaquinone biosynthesis C-methylase UbiE
MNASRKEIWTSGEAYDAYVGRWSRLVAREFVTWLGISAGGGWLDVGCGTGALSQAILAHAALQRVIGIDPSMEYIMYAHDHVADARAHFQVGDASASHCVSLNHYVISFK